jgi:hypothetical protein
MQRTAKTASEPKGTDAVFYVVGKEVGFTRPRSYSKTVPQGLRGRTQTTNPKQQREQ